VSERSIWASRALLPLPVGERARVRAVSRDGRIASIETDVDPEAADESYPDALLAPGLVDLQVNGALGVAFAAPDAAERRRAVDWHVRAGTTSLLATLVSAPLDSLAAALERLAGDSNAGGPVLGIHLEGPFLAPEKCGAHDPRSLVEPTREAVERLVACAGDALRMVTLAPELPGALEAVERFARASVVVAAGHSCAELTQVRAALARGLSFVTHVGNASDWPTRRFDPQLGYRRSEPGLVGAFMLEPRLRGSLILDGVHVHPELARALIELRGPENVALVSDASPAAGLPPGHYRLGALDAEIHPEGFATAGEGLAGSVVPLMEVVRTAVREAGVPLERALRMASEMPARTLGVEDRKGRLLAGADADWLLLADDLELSAVYRAGELVV